MTRHERPDTDARGPEPDREPERSPADGRARLLAALRRPGSRGQAVVAVLLAVLGFAAVTQVQSNGRDDNYVGARQGDLIQLINNLSLASQRAENEITKLQRTRDSLGNDTEARRTALERARQQAEHARHPRRHAARRGARRSGSPSRTRPRARASAPTSSSTGCRSCETRAPR